jgi:nucleotide sugar dehydrogenase
MPAVLNLKPEEFDSNDKRSKYTVGIVGCGQTGIFYANAFAGAGFKVVCTDADASVIKKVAKGKTPFPNPEAETKLKKHIASGQINAVAELKKVACQSDITIITLTAKIDGQKKVDYSEVINVCKQVGAALQQGALVLYCGVAGFGFVEGAMKETLENTSGLKAGLSFGLAYNPIENADCSAANLELKVAGIGKASLEASANTLKSIAKTVTQLSDVKTAETAALFSVAKQDANIALANELAVFCENANVDYFEVLKIVGLDSKSFGPHVLEEKNAKDAYLLLDNAENLNTKLRLAAMARQINEEMVKHAVSLTQDALRSCGKTLRRARVAVLAAADPALTGVFVRLIEQKGAKVSLYDPASKKEPMDSRLVKTSLNEAVEGADCVAILTLLNRLNLKKLKPLMKSPSVIVDLTGGLEPQEVKAEGFIYCGLGRGIV